MGMYEDSWDAADAASDKNFKENKAFFASLTNEEKFDLMWKYFETAHCGDYRLAEANSSIKKKSGMLERKRLNILLLNAVNLLLKEGYTRAKIMEELGMTEKEFEAVGEK